MSLIAFYPFSEIIQFWFDNLIGQSELRMINLPIIFSAWQFFKFDPQNFLLLSKSLFSFSICRFIAFWVFLDAQARERENRERGERALMEEERSKTSSGGSLLVDSLVMAALPKNHSLTLPWHLPKPSFTSTINTSLSYHLKKYIRESTSGNHGTKIVFGRKSENQNSKVWIWRPKTVRLVG